MMMYYDNIAYVINNDNISTCICIRKCNKNGEFSPSHFCQNLAKDHVL